MYLGNSYKNFPGFYDLLYQRYLKSVPDFVALVRKSTPRGGSILDLAAGTGEVSIPLLRSGYKVISLDASRGMLKELKSKAKRLGVRGYRVKVSDMKKISYKEKFDVVCIRQAVNYFIGTRVLRLGFKNIFASLKTGGKLIFNAPNYHGEKAYPIISNIYKGGKQNAFVLEINRVVGRVLKHKQYSIIWEEGKKPNFFSDDNYFYMFTKNEFERTLKKCGFSKIEFSGSDKTLYCVATK